jgi:hypothetical protein
MLSPDLSAVGDACPDGRMFVILMIQANDDTGEFCRGCQKWMATGVPAREALPGEASAAVLISFLVFVPLDAQLDQAIDQMRIG